MYNQISNVYGGPSLYGAGISPDFNFKSYAQGLYDAINFLLGSSMGGYNQGTGGLPGYDGYSSALSSGLYPLFQSPIYSQPPQQNAAPQAAATDPNVKGTNGDDTMILFGTTGDDRLVQDGRGGNDTMYIGGDAGNDKIWQYGGTGNDMMTVDGGTGNDRITQQGGLGNDNMFVDIGPGNDVVTQSGGAGDDQLQSYGGDGNDRITVDGGLGADTINLDGGAGDDQLYVTGGLGKDNVTYNVSAGKDLANLAGGRGSDTLTINANNQNFVVKDANGKVIYQQGTGDSEINVQSFEHITIIGNDGNPVYQT